MIIPTFKIEQDAQHLYIYINAPFAKVRKSEQKKFHFLDLKHASFFFYYY